MRNRPFPASLQPGGARSVLLREPMSHLRQLVHHTLRATKRPAGMMQGELEVGLFGNAAGPAARAAAYAGCGIDVAHGECLLAGIYTHDEHRGFEHRLVGAVTSRRTIFGGYSTVKGHLNELRGSVDHDEVIGFEAKTGLVSAKCEVLTTRGPLNFLGLWSRFPEIEVFFRGLLQLPMGQRGEPPMPLAAPTHDDPTGAHAALAQLWFPDDRTHALLAATIDAVHRGAIDVASAADLVARIQIAHRSTCSGVAAAGHAFCSPLSADDLGHVLAGVLGAPIGYGNPQPGVHCLDFRIDPTRDSLSPTLTALGIASFFAVGIGFSPGRMIAADLMKKQPVQAIRVVYYDVPGGCAYELYANGRRLEVGEAELAHALHLLLLHSAWPVLERRCRSGWQMPYPQLFAS